MKYIKENFLVVTDYNWLPDDLNESWVHQYSDNYLIYDRCHRFPESNKVKHQKNVGQNIYDIFDYIVTYYDNLPETILFCRACIMSPKDDGIIRYKNGVKVGIGSCTEETFRRLCNNKTLTELQDHTSEPWRINGHSNKIGPDNSYLELNNSWYLHHIWKTKYYSNINTFFSDIYINPPIQQYLRFAPAANYIIPKKNILRYSKKFYEKIREIVSWDVIVGEAHMIERAMYTIFSCDYEVKDEYR